MFKINYVLLFTIMFSIIQFSFTEVFVRYNLAGYFPETEKSIIVMGDEDCAGMEWTIKNASGKKMLSGRIQESLAGKSGFTPKPYNYKIYFTKITNSGVYSFSVNGTKYADLKINRNPYGKILSEMVRFLKVHRSGTNDVLDREPAHFGDSSCYIYRRKNDLNTIWEEDANGKKVNMKGGWYEGFSFIKFTLTNAHITYYLLRSYELNSGLFQKIYSKTKLVDILDEAKFGLEYLLKAMPDENEFIIEVGGFLDTENGTKLPHLDSRDTKREAYSAISLPQMGSAIAALALGSSVFYKLGNKKDANAYKKMALKIFKKAISNDIEKEAWIKKGYDICKDSTSFDNLLLGAVELYRLTNDQSILAKAKIFAQKAQNTNWASFADLHMTAHNRFMEIYPKSKEFLINDLDSYNDYSKKKNNVWGQPIEYTYYSLYPFLEIASAALQYQITTKDKKFNSMVLNMVNYAFGQNNWGRSFISSKSIKGSVRNYYSQIYVLQTHLFPSGGISSGPIDTKSHKSESIWCFYDQNARPEQEFNTPSVRFFDHSDDFMCMSASTYGIADGIFLLTQMSTLYGQK